MCSMPLIHRAKNRQAEIKKVLDDFLPAYACVSFQEVILFLPGKAYGFASGGFTERFTVDRHDFREVSEIAEIVAQIHPRVGRGLPD